MDLLFGRGGGGLEVECVFSVGVGGVGRGCWGVRECDLGVKVEEGEVEV